MGVFLLLCEYLLDFRVVSSLFVLLVTYYVAQFYMTVRTLPPGPFPLPFIGNILDLRKEHPLYVKAMKWCEQYGDPFTIWVGTRPIVVASTKESFKEVGGPYRNILGGRMKTILGELQSRGYEDLLFSDFAPAWDVLRRLVHVAIRKYAQTEKMAVLCKDLVDQVLQRVLNGKDSVEVEIVEYIDNIIFNVVGISCFGGTFQSGDPDFETMREADKTFQEVLGNGLPSDIMPILKYVFWKKEQMAKKLFEDVAGVTDRLYGKAAATYKQGQSRHFTDVLLASREQFLAEDKASAKYLTDGNLRQAIFNIFGAGTGTSKTILGYGFLRLAANPQLQEELRGEITEVLGDRHAVLEDRQKLPLVDSFIEETVRFHAPAPLGVPRRAMTSVTINGRYIPQDTAFMTNIYAVNRDPTLFGSDANEFKPERFLNKTKDMNHTSFGIGARSCPGEKMAQADIFYCLVRTLQKVRLESPGSPDQINLETMESDLFVEARRQNLKIVPI